MAKRKDDIMQSVMENENLVTDPIEDIEVQTEGNEETPVGDPQNNNTTDEIPARVKKILSLYPNYEELYIDNKGGVYVTAPKHSAQLYKNPYYTK